VQVTGECGSVRGDERPNSIVGSKSGEGRRRLDHGGGGHQSGYGDPYGVLGLCQMVRPGVYDLNQGNLRAGWEAVGEFRATTLAPEDYACRECPVAGLCAPCPARAQREHGDPTAVVAVACQVAHLRAERLGWNVGS
jgi:radical SAM protein with 4Fe4S-binding SPASM domain